MAAVCDTESPAVRVNIYAAIESDHVLLMELITFFQIHLLIVDGEFSRKCGQFEHLAVTVKVETQCLRWNLCAADQIVISNFLSIVPDKNFLFWRCFLQVPID